MGLVTAETSADGVLVLTLNDPHRLNSLSHGPGSMMDSLLSAIRDADKDPSVRCLVITGAGRAFSSGGTSGDRSPETPREWFEFLEGNAQEFESVRQRSTPIIGAINGICYGAALILSTQFDILIASDSARFGLIETRFGSTGAQTLAYAVGVQWAKFLALTGELIDARTAKEIGLVISVCADDELLDRAVALASRVAAMPADGVRFNRRVINGVLTMQGWHGQQEYALAMNTVTNLLARDAQSTDGRNLREILATKGWHAYKEARDQAFKEPWLRHPEDGGRT